MTSSKKPWISVLQPCKELAEKALKVFLLFLVGVYRTLGTTHLGGACRFTPSCSEYAVQALQKHRFFSALSLISQRLLKCRPGGSCGYDPVPHCAGECHART